MTPRKKKTHSKALVYSNLAISLDGKINIAGKGHFPLGTREDWNEMQRLRKKADAIVFGASTLRGFKSACCVEDPRWPRSKQPVNVVLSSELKGISPRWSFFRDPRIRRILIVDKKAPLARLQLFVDSCDIIQLESGKKSAPLATQCLVALRDRGLQSILVEGGGQVMWEFLKANELEELHLTLTPRILGGATAPTLVEGTGFTAAQVKNFELIRSKKVGDELYLTYRRRSQDGLKPAW